MERSVNTDSINWKQNRLLHVIFSYLRYVLMKFPLMSPKETNLVPCSAFRSIIIYLAFLRWTSVAAHFLFQSKHELLSSVAQNLTHHLTSVRETVQLHAWQYQPFIRFRRVRFKDRPLALQSHAPADMSTWEIGCERGRTRNHRYNTQ